MQGCLIWEYARAKDGHGIKNIREAGKKTTTPAHRWAWEQVNGKVPAGLVVRHICDNPACVRIDHLELGTQRDNIQDSVKRGRWRASHGSILDESIIESMRARLATGRRGTGAALAAEYGVSRATITNIKNRKVWA